MCRWWRRETQKPNPVGGVVASLADCGFGVFVPGRSSRPGRILAAHVVDDGTVLGAFEH